MAKLDLAASQLVVLSTKYRDPRELGKFYLKIVKTLTCTGVDDGEGSK